MGDQEPLAEWWYRTCQADMVGFLPKFEEYGAHDLVEIGRDLLRFRGEDPDEISTRQCAELGVAFYLRGKVARAMEAYARGDEPSEDTLHDITVYSLMARCIRERGQLG